MALALAAGFPVNAPLLEVDGDHFKVLGDAEPPGAQLLRWSMSLSPISPAICLSLHISWTQGWPSLASCATFVPLAAPAGFSFFSWLPAWCFSRNAEGCLHSSSTHFTPPPLFHGCYVFRQHYMCFSFALAVRDGWYSIIHVIMGYSGSGSALQDSLFTLHSQKDFQGKFLFPKVLICIGCYCHKHMKSLHGFEIPNFLLAGPLSFQSWKDLCNLERQNSGSDGLLKHQIREVCLDL